MGPRGAARGLDHREVAHERAGVRRGSPDARSASPDREQDDRRRGRGGRVDERPAVAEVLGVDGDQLRAIVGGERRHQLSEVDIGLVTDRRKPREAHLDLPRQDPELERQVPALRDEADRAGRELVRRQAQVGRGIEDAEAVRAEQHRPRRPDTLHERPLALRRPARRRRPARTPPPGRRSRPAPAHREGREATRTQAGRGRCRRFG